MLFLLLSIIGSSSAYIASINGFIDFDRVLKISEIYSFIGFLGCCLILLYYTYKSHKDELSISERHDKKILSAICILLVIFLILNVTSKYSDNIYIVAISMFILINSINGIILMARYKPRIVEGGTK